MEFNVDTAISTVSVIITVATIVMSVLKSKKEGKTLGEALTLLVNVLKVEDKMTPDGKFKQDLIDKTQVAAEALKVGQEAKDQVTKIISNGEHAGDIKVASIKGKPIYVGDIVGIGSSLAGALLKLRGLRK